MASHTLASVNDKWPDGTVVSCYLRDAHGNASGAAVDTDTVTSGALTFTGLADATNYIASQGGKSVQFRTPTAVASGSGVPAGGTTGQFLAKNSNTDGDAGWTNGSGTPSDGSVTAAKLAATLAAVEAWTDLGNLGATETITAAANKVLRRKGTLDQACAITLTTAADQQIELVLAQDGTGGRAATFTGVNVWLTSAGVAPVLTGRASGAVDRFYFENVGGIVYGYWLTETITGAAGVTVQEEDSSVGAATTLDFRGSWVTAVAGGAGEALIKVGRLVGPTSPAEAKAQTVERGFNGLNLSALSSGRMTLVAIELFEGMVLNGIAFFSGSTAMAAGSNQWFTLTDSACSRLVSTVDDGATAWAANAKKKLAFASPYTVLTSGLFYLGITVVATTVPNLMGPGLASSYMAEPPIVTGTGDTGLTNPASWDGVTSTLNATGNMPYAYVY
jgi:hypothetical protein